MKKLDDAIHFAVDAHSRQVRKLSGAPYILHPIEALSIVSQLTDDEDVLCATVLHDVVEDTPATIEDVRERFGDRVAELVSAETENKREGLPPDATWKIRKEETLDHLAKTDDVNVRIMWLGDKLSNMRSMLIEYLKEGDGIFIHFNQHDKSEQEWYYRSILKELEKDFAATPALFEYRAIVDYIFNKDKG
ncbi:MAG: bifunctional (p)ppGpp synthetase/guanosine-3',5'-bis(diphosphate) 3'-pyrophosphohydrolase [Clostridia bacterium]|nr:bifunctional (p)ppGpp synthetase/guanosine-3',5'-bis(diphosphate) 3'-pyrophosphohydrolase [Clostridia bacterium]